jgi:hypothetical protein
LPHRDYGLAPEWREQTISYLNGLFYRMGYVLLGFIACIYWLVMRANALTPPWLATAWIFACVSMLLMGLLFNIVALFRRFGQEKNLI